MIEDIFNSKRVYCLKMNHFYNDDEEAYKVIDIRDGLISYTAKVRNIATQELFEIKEWFFGIKNYKKSIEVKK